MLSAWAYHLWPGCWEGLTSKHGQWCPPTGHVYCPGFREGPIESISICSPLASLTLGHPLEGSSAHLSSSWECPQFILFLSSPRSPSLELIFFLGHLNLVWGNKNTITKSLHEILGKILPRSSEIRLPGRAGLLTHWVFWESHHSSAGLSLPICKMRKLDPGLRSFFLA